jgi:carbon-monoxide dehydrogenase medium subunit
MHTANFDYYRASTVAEAVKLLKRNKGAKLLAGGHSLIPAMKMRIAEPTALIDISRIKGLAGVTASKSSLKIGAMTTHAALADSAAVKKHCAILAEAASLIGDQQVRNRGTIGGSLAHADPAADYPTVMLALGATLSTTSGAGKRQIPAEKFFVDLFTTALKANEILTTITLPMYGKGTGGAYIKHAHPASGYAVVGVAALATVKNGVFAKMSVVVGGITPTPYHAITVERELLGKAANESIIAAAAAHAADGVTHPIGDEVYASGDYRKHLAAVLTKRAVLKAVERAN